MKMIMPLKATESGKINHEMSPGSIIAAGDLLASLQLAVSFSFFLYFWEEREEGEEGEGGVVFWKEGGAGVGACLCRTFNEDWHCLASVRTGVLVC